MKLNNLIKLVNDDEVKLMQRKGAGTLAVIRVGLLMWLLALAADIHNGTDTGPTLTAGLTFLGSCLLWLVGGNAVDKVNDTVARIKGAPAPTETPTTTQS